jgi:FKBP-type peptidyl-prolyl cis-trans isomerase SlyD
LIRQVTPPRFIFYHNGGVILNANNQPELIADDVVVALDYTLTVDNEVVDTSEGSEPIQFLQGHGNIIPGLEQSLYGMAAGDRKEIVVAAADGYGELDPDAYADVPRKEFPPQIPMEVGIELELKDKSGDIMDARIDAVNEETVRLDFNHPLAGKQLNFAVQVVALRQPSEEELEHGHVHMPGHAH